jgi:acyl-CoA reductase-like NAD-dependent aldehyde dehydrogenase
MLVPSEDLALIQALILEHSKAFTVGSPDSVDVKVGPVASRKQYDKVRSYILKGLEEGAEIILGEVPPVEPQQGYFIQPTVFTNADNSMAIARDEIFGPVLCVIPYDSVEEAIKIANDTPYGLAGAVFGPEADAKKIALALRTGTVYVNNGKRDMDAPFGGYKQSGIGREGGHWGIEEFLEIKAVFDFPNTVTPL